MIVEYHRPQQIDEALTLLSRKEPATLPIGGGTVLSRALRSGQTPYAVVDLQDLKLDESRQEGQLLIIGATTRLQSLYENTRLPQALRESLRLEASLNQRCMATLAGSIISCDGRSPFVTALLALDPRIEWAGQEEPESLGDFLAFKAADTAKAVRGRLMMGLSLPLNVDLRFESVARSPVDRPVVCAAAGRWPSGRTRLALGGWGGAPMLAMDGPEPGGAAAAARSAFLSAGDEWASAEYRADVAARLAARLTATNEKGM